MKARILIALSALLCTACSVKEQRISCPCRLEVDFSRFSDVTRSVVFGLDGVVSDKLLSDKDSLVSVMTIKRSERVRVVVWSGVSRKRASNLVLSAPEGEEADSLFLFGTSVPALDDKVRLLAIPHKQFANVVLQISTSNQGNEYLNYTVRSNYGSIDLASGASLPGKMSIPLKGVKGNQSFRIPRQEPGCELVLEAYDKYGNRHVYPLGEWILDAGYDWKAQDLDDIVIGADFMLGIFSVSVKEWNPGEVRDQIL